MSTAILAASPFSSSPPKVQGEITTVVISQPSQSPPSLANHSQQPQQPQPPQPSPLDRLAAAWRRAESASTSATIRRGELLHRYLARELAGLSGGRRRAARGRLIEEAVERLAGEGWDVNATRLLKIYAVANLLGENEAATISAAVLAEFAPLVHRLADEEEYELLHPQAARSLWARAAADRLGHDAVHDEVSRILGRVTEPAAHRRPGADFAAIASRATKDDIVEFVAHLSDDLMDYLAGLIR